MKAYKFILCGLFAILIGCDGKTTTTPFSGAQAAMTESINTAISLDLSVARTDERTTVRGNQIYYDVGNEPTTMGFVSIKINNVQNAPITMTPGGSITFEGITDVFISNTSQPGKRATLLINSDSSITGNPASPLSQGVTTNKYGIGDGLQSQARHLSASPGSPPVSVLYVFGQVVVASLTVTIHSSTDPRDSLRIGFEDTVNFTLNPIGLFSAGTHRFEDIYIPPGWALYVTGGGTLAGTPPGTTNFFGTMVFSVATLSRPVL